MEKIIEVFQYDYAIRAFYASAMVGIMCGILGCFIVLRNMSLIGDALSHAILPGVVAGFLIAGYSLLGFFTGSVVAGLLAAVLITWIQRNVKTQEDAAIGIVFTSMFAIGVMGISWLTRQEGVHLDLKDFLFGNILGISDQDLWMTFLILAFTILCVAIFYRYFFVTTFESVVAQTIGISVSTMHYFLMLLLSFAVVASLQSVGVILVVAMLITPASTAYLLTTRLQNMILIAAGMGLLSTTLGLLIAILFETTPGPAMTVTATGLYLSAVLFSPQRGLVSRYIKRQRKRSRILQEDVLKQAVRLHEKRQLTPTALQQKLGVNSLRIRRALRKLENQGNLSLQKGLLKLTDKGIEGGYALVRAHRLWETYLVKEMGLSEDQIHENAEKYEHILTDALVEEVAKSLGNPLTDPHGSPIPEKSGSLLKNLATLISGEKAKISSYQINHLVRSDLWKRGLHPLVEFEIGKVEADEIEVNFEGKSIRIPVAMARKIKIER
ncbi:MAG: iron chelate uptake ABC transporter family permease subunit [Bacteroidia bacterium]|nr:iron chelate uptake ABC transporter family permease subunit [Bacteroidia bacterium]